MVYNIIKKNKAKANFVEIKYAMKVADTNITNNLCRICDGTVECAPTALLLITLIHSLFGYIGEEPEYLGSGASAYNPEEDDLNVVEDESVYDFIVIGGGTAGCVVASRLSENRNWKVLLLEAGPLQPPMALIPSLTSEFKGSSLDWKYVMRPSKRACLNRGDKGCEIVQGRVLGGTSTINDMVYMRGHPVDYDDWERDGNDGWGFNKVLPYFKYSERNYDKDIYQNEEFHSTDGPLDIGRYRYADVNVDLILGALHELRYNYTDINGRTPLGFTRVQTMSYLGERVSTNTAFIEPIKNLRANIKIVTEVKVTKILFDTRDVLTAVGVECFKKGTKYIIKATKEVILTAGTINSPKILMQSGIGQRDYLEFLNIKVLINLPVGGNFHDHLSVCLPMVKLTQTATTTNFAEKLRDITAYYVKGSGPMSANFQALAYFETTLSDILGTPDIEYRFRGHNSNMYYDSIEICTSLLTPESRGQIMLNSTDATFGNPLIYPNFLQSHRDRQKLFQGIQEIIKIFDTEVFRRAGFDFNPVHILNNECGFYNKVSEAFWMCLIRYFSAPLHNYVGTCKMGPPTDPEAIVDNALRVYGVLNLRVVDASIIPKIPRGSTAAPVIMIAEKASEEIKQTWY